MPNLTIQSRRAAGALYPGIAALFFLSGATSLVYEVAWLRSLLLIFGSTTFAVSTVLTAFMGGLAAGSCMAGRWIDRRGNPLIVYGLLEAAIGLYALATPQLFAAIGPAYRAFWVAFQPPDYLFALVRFVLCFAVLFLPAALMGATLPALARYCASLRRALAVSVGALYGLNTIGAFLGTLACGFWLLPSLGLEATIRLTASVNLLVGAAALGLAFWTRRPVPAEGAAPAAARPRLPLTRARVAVITAFALTGFGALMLEVAWTRILALVIGPSVYAFALMLAAFLAGLGLGSVIFSWVVGRVRVSGAGLFVALATAVALLAYFTLLAFHRLPYLYAVLFHRWTVGAGDATAAFAIALLVSTLVMLPPTLGMGGLFPAAVSAFGLSGEVAGRGVGSLYAANSAGAIAGSFAAGFLVIPALGLQGTVLAAVCLYLAVAVAVAWVVQSERRRLLPFTAVVVALAAGLVLLAPPWNRLVMSSGVYHYADDYGEPGSAYAFKEQVTWGFDELFYREGRTATVLVASERNGYGRLGEDTVPEIFLATNGKIDASSIADMPTQVLSAHIPLLLHPAPRRALVIGLASGTTAGSALNHPIESLDILEIEPAIIDASRLFDVVNGQPLEDPRTRLTVADGRTFLFLTDRSFDVIISEPSNPWITGVSNLFTLEFFELVRARLAEGGLFAQWVQMYRMAPASLEALLRTFNSVFPQAYVFNTIPYTDLLLVGATDPVRIDLSEIAHRMARPEVAQDLARVDVHSAAELLATGRLGPQEVADWTAQVELLNTDDNALIEFAAPLDLHRNTRGINDRRLQTFARGLAHYIEGVGADRRFLEKLAAAYEGRGYYVEAGETQRASRLGER